MYPIFSYFQAIILLYSGRSEYYRTNVTRYYGFSDAEAAEKKDITKLNWPGNLNLQAKNRKWKTGIDTKHHFFRTSRRRRPMAFGK